MSSREQLLKRAVEAVHSTEWLSDDIIAYSDENGRATAEGDIAEAVLRTLLPQVTDHRQMEVGVPDGSILLVAIQAGARALRWEDGMLHGNLRADGMPVDAKWVIERYGPLTVVWMP